MNSTGVSTEYCMGTALYCRFNSIQLILIMFIIRRNTITMSPLGSMYTNYIIYFEIYFCTIDTGIELRMKIESRSEPTVLISSIDLQVRVRTWYLTFIKHTSTWLLWARAVSSRSSHLMPQVSTMHDHNVTRAATKNVACGLTRATFEISRAPFDTQTLCVLCTA